MQGDKGIQRGVAEINMITETNAVNTYRTYKVAIRVPLKFIRLFRAYHIKYNQHDRCDKDDYISQYVSIYDHIVEDSTIKLVLCMSGLLDKYEVKAVGTQTNREIPYNYDYEYVFDESNIPECKICFNMPAEDVSIFLVDHKSSTEQMQNKEDKLMEPKTQSQQVVASFQIEEAVAKQLSELLIKQSIREKLLDQNINNPTKYEQMEQMLIPIVAEIEALKNHITNECVPAEYRSEQYVWNYDGYEIDGCTVYIYNA